MLLAVGLMASGAVAASITGQWDFTNNLTATTGSDITEYLGANAAVDYSYANTTVNGSADTVLSWDFTADYDHFYVPHGIAANGGGTRVNEFSIIMDVKFDLGAGGTGNYHSLWNTDTDDPWANDADMYYWKSTATNGQLGVGSSGYTDGGQGLDQSTWHRVVFATDGPNNQMKIYRDGVVLWDQANDFIKMGGSGQPIGTGTGVDDRQSLSVTSPWINLFSAGVWYSYMYGGTGEIAALQFRDYTMSGAEAASFGAADGAIPTTVVPEPMTLTLLGIGALGLIRRKKK